MSTRRQSGAAMTEAVVALPVLVLILLGTGYIHGLYRARIEAQHRATAVVWAAASAGCTGDAPAPQSANDVGAADAVERLDPAARRPALFASGRAHAIRNAHATGLRIPWLNGQAQHDVQASAEVTCNEIPQPSPMNTLPRGFEKLLQ